MNKFDASVIILTYNQSNILPSILDALKCQETKFTFETIITDDGSDLHHQENILNLIKEYLNVSFVSHEHLGMRTAKARNNALKRANSSIAILLDGDIVPRSDFVEKHIAEHRKNQCPILLCGKREWHDISELGTIQINEYNAKIARMRGQKEQAAKEQQLTSKTPWVGFYTCNLSFPISHKSLQDENFCGWGVDDTELAYRLSQKEGHSLIYRDDIVVEHYDDVEISQNPYRGADQVKHKLLINNLLYFMEKYPDDFVLQEYLINALSRFKIKKDNTSEKVPADIWKPIVITCQNQVIQKKSIYEAFVKLR